MGEDMPTPTSMIASESGIKFLKKLACDEKTKRDVTTLQHHMGLKVRQADWVPDGMIVLAMSDGTCVLVKMETNAATQQEASE